MKEDGKKYESLVPLPEVISACMGYSTASKKVQGYFEKMLQTLGTEFDILRNVPSEDIKSCAGERIACLLYTSNLFFQKYDWELLLGKAQIPDICLLRCNFWHLSDMTEKNHTAKCRIVQ